MRDKARVIRQEPRLDVSSNRVRVNGGYINEPVTGPPELPTWFRCAYDPGSEDESRGDGGVRRRRRGATVVCKRRATDGTEIDLKPSDVLEVDSRPLGLFTVSVTDTPERLYKGRVWIGWLVHVGATDRSAV